MSAAAFDGYAMGLLTNMRPFNRDVIPRPPGEGVTLPPGPIAIDVGAGQGLFAVQFAQAYPDTTLIAIEKTHERFARLQQRVVYNHCPNVIAVHANAVNWIAHHIPETSVDQYFFWYPNPYPKARQQNKRYHAMPFMGYLLQTLKPGGRLTFATNQRFYHEETRYFMGQVWELPCLAEAQVDPTIQPRTHFEKKYLARGEPCWELTFGRV